MKSVISVILFSFMVGGCASSTEDAHRTGAEAVGVAAPSAQSFDVADAKARLELPRVAETLGGGKAASAYQIDEGFFFVTSIARRSARTTRRRRPTPSRTSCTIACIRSSKVGRWSRA